MALSVEELTERNQATLARFVVRLRRVASHSMAQDLEVLSGYASGSFEVHGSDNGARIVRKIPKQEELESLGARVRPLLLSKEDVYYSKGIGALKYLMQRSPKLKRPEVLSAVCKDLKNQWRSLEEHSRRDDDPSVRVLDPSDNQTYEHTWRKLAWAWVYIDLVHEDTSRVADSGRFRIRERYWGGMILMARATKHAVAHLDLIKQSVDRGIIELPDFAFAEDVEVSQEDFVNEAKVHVAPIGTKAPEHFEAPGPEWSTIESVVANSGDDQSV